jgi:hypothetical protein
MKKTNELDREKLTLQEVSITPSGDLVLAELGIDPTDLKSIKPRWKRTQYRAIVNWLANYKPPPDTSHIEEVKGFLEAFHHLCEIEAWEEARKILSTVINTPSYEQLHNQLRYWVIIANRLSCIEEY